MIFRVLNKYFNTYFDDNQLFIFLSCTKKITSENNIYVSLFSNKCGKSARFTKKRFGKFFHIAEDWQIEPIKYNFDELG